MGDNDVYKPAKGVRLEQGKFYRTKGGRKVYIATDDKHWCYGIIEDNKVATVYERNGLVHYNRNEPVYPRDDIVSEWKWQALTGYLWVTAFFGA